MYYSEDRNIKLAILSYDLEIKTLEHIAKIHSGTKTEVDCLRKVVSSYLYQSELLMKNNIKKEAEKNLLNIIKILENIFSKLEGKSILNAALLLFQIKIYFNEKKNAGLYMKFIDDYDKEKKLDINSEEYKALKSISIRMKNFYEDRDLYSKENLKDFHLDK